MKVLLIALDIVLYFEVDISCIIVFYQLDYEHLSIDVLIIYIKVCAWKISKKCPFGYLVFRYKIQEMQIGALQ